MKGLRVIPAIGNHEFSGCQPEACLDHWWATFPELRGKLLHPERESIQLIAEGNSSKEIAVSLGIANKTVEAHRANIMRKLRLHSVSDLVRYAIRNKLVQP